MIPSKPYALIRALQQYDATLRLRWGTHQKLWIIEKQMPPRHRQLLAERPNPFKSARSQDLHDGWREGFVHVLNVHPTLAENVPLVMEHIREADIWRQGGLDAMNARFDEIEAQQEQAQERELQNFNEGAAKEAHDRIAWLEKRRVAT